MTVVQSGRLFADGPRSSADGSLSSTDGARARSIVSIRIGIVGKSKVEEEEDEDWLEGDPIEVQWVEDETLEEILDQRRMDGGSLQAEHQELVVHERMSQDTEVKWIELISIK